MTLTHEKLNKEIEEYLANGGTIKQVTTNPYKFYDHEHNAALRSWYEANVSMSEIEMARFMGISKLDLKLYVKGLKKLNKHKVIERIPR